MTPETPLHYVYVIDGSDQITFVSPEWLHFAESNEAPELTEAHVVGKPIWHFITGEEARILYSNIYSNLRSRRSGMTIPFRCDAPTEIRHMMLTLHLLGAGAIECEGRVVRTEARESVTPLSRGAARSNQAIPICSLCRSLSVRGEWLEVRAAIVRKRLFAVPLVPRLEETVCPDCKSLGA